MVAPSSNINNTHSPLINHSYISSHVRPLVSTHETASWSHESSEAHTRPTVDQKNKALSEACENNRSFILKNKQSSYIWCRNKLLCHSNTASRHAYTSLHSPLHAHIPIRPCTHPPCSPLHDLIPLSPCISTITLHITYAPYILETLWNQYYRMEFYRYIKYFI